MRVTPGADWTVRREALAAVLRRIEIAEKEELRIARRPVPGFGRYRTEIPGKPRKRYETRLYAVDPIDGSCDCRDFVRASLGVCKHLLVALTDVFKRPRRVVDAIRSRRARMAPQVEQRLGFSWDPIRPLSGRGGALDRIRYRCGEGDRLPAGLSKFFRGVKEGEFAPVLDFDAPAKRLAFVDSLLRLGAGQLEPALRALLEDERGRAFRLVRLAARKQSLRTGLRLLKRKLYPYQEEGVERLLSRGRQVLADDMGLGKTTQATAACHALFHAKLVRRGILVTPAALKPQWEREWRETTDVPIRVVSGPPSERAAAYREVKERGGFLIANYELTMRDLDALLEFDADIVVLDEAQRVKNWAAATTVCVRRLQPEFRFVLTGTPMENRLDELATILEWVDDRALEPRWCLTPYHATFADGRKVVVGAKSLDTLRVRLAPCLLRRRRDEVLKQLPSRSDLVIPIEMTPEQLERHDALSESIMKLVALLERRPLTQPEHLRLMQLFTLQRDISNGLALADFNTVWPELTETVATPERLARLASPKLSEFREVISQLVLEQGRKVVVFSQWRGMLRLADWAVRDLLSEAGLRGVFFTGAEGAKRRQQNIVEFHDDPSCRIFFATDAGGVGLNLQRAANAVVNLELPWNPAVLEQRIGRIYRLGQTKPIDVVDLVASEGIEQRIFTLVRDKRALFGALFNGKTNEVSFENNGRFLEQIVAKVAPSVKSTKSAARVLEAANAEESESDVDGSELANPLDESPINTAHSLLTESLAGADGPGAEPTSAISPDATALPTDAEITRLFQAVRVSRNANGNVSIEAPKAALESLAAVLDGITRMLREER